jgi:hypothetical protein
VENPSRTKLIANILVPAHGKKVNKETIFGLNRTMMSSQGSDGMIKALLYRLAKIEPHFQRLTKSKHFGSEAEEKEFFASQYSKE